MVVAGQTINTESLMIGFVIAGTAVSAGGPAVTIDGTVISLQPSGILPVGSGTASANRTTNTTLAGVICNVPIAEGGQKRSGGLIILLPFIL